MAELKSKPRKTFLIMVPIVVGALGVVLNLEEELSKLDIERKSKG